MDVRDTAIPGVKLIAPQRFGDDRGFFSETWSDAAWRGAGLEAAFVQDNHARSEAALTLRGLHFQIPPAAQGKLIRVAAGAIFDVAVDIRVGSPTYGRHAASVVSRAAWNQVWIPPGFAHGYLTLEPGTEVIYKTTAAHSPTHERGLRFDDPALGIAWPTGGGCVTASPRDRDWPVLADLPAYFCDAGRR